MAFFLVEMNGKFVQISHLNSPDFAEKFVIYRRKKVKLNFIKYSSDDDRFRGEKSPRNEEKFQFRRQLSSFSCCFSSK